MPVTGPRLLWAVLGLTAAGCTSTYRVDPPAVPALSSQDALSIVRDELAGNGPYGHPGFTDGNGRFVNPQPVDLRVRTSGARFTVRVTENNPPTANAVVDLPFTSPITGFACEVGQCDIYARASLANSEGGLEPTYATRFVYCFLPFRGDAAARRFAEAYNTLVLLNRGSPDQDREFSSQAAAWRSANPKPPMSESGRRNKVLAENAFREKNVESAIEYYGAALESDPTWPNGNFNLALLLAESGDYALAARHMRRYLMLEPDSRDARAANDKLIVWEEKARRGQ